MVILIKCEEMRSVAKMYYLCAKNVLITINGFNDMKFGVWCAIGAGNITRKNISHEKKIYSQHDIRFLQTSNSHLIGY